MMPADAAAALSRALPSLDEIRAAAGRIEGWLLSDAVQLAAGPAAGGIAGWLDDSGEPVFAYGEITGYWLTWAAGICGQREAIAARIAAAVSFLDREWHHERPKTRHYLRAAPADWRNRALFSFDMAMMLRGLACAAEIVDPRICAAAAERIVPWLLRCIGPEGTLRTHVMLDGEDALPDRWSTRPGPFQMKAAASLLRAPAAWLPAELARAAERTLAKWRGRAGEHRDLHPRFYALEGEVLTGAAADPSLARTVIPPDGRLRAASADPGEAVRADVLAQAARILLSVNGGIADNAKNPVMALVGALLDHVEPEGGVLFDAASGSRNVWCAIFAAQALSWMLVCAFGGAADTQKLV